MKKKAEAIFDATVDLPAEDLPAAIGAACGDDSALAARVKALHAGVLAAEGFLGDPTADSAPVTEKPGTVIGRYKLLQQIGEGGFGVVFMAEQEKPVRRLVALKVIKLGMDTREVVARFEAERQALAMMDHPNIARVLDAGSTEAGRPYFVMELVRGSPITEYCDKHKLDTAGRVELVAQVCRAVQHAHTKGILHRDIKPSNVLVTVADDKPIPKVIDFGIAKATQSKLTDRTLFTAFRQLIGTPQYMSPEQADSDGTDVDTRTDVYSLGVLLYELLVGSTPLDAKSLRSAAYEEMRRIIREVDPPRPSTKLSGLGETLQTVAINRGTDARHLSQMVRGELDWIVMRALEKDRGRRYDTAAAFADDLIRYIKHEAVLAGPPSGLYQLRKLVGRHRTALAVTAAVVLVVAAGVIGATAGFVRLQTTRLEARAFAYRAAINEAGLALRNGDGPRFAKQLAAAPVEHRGWEWNWLDRAGTLRQRHRLDSDPGERFVWITTATNTRLAGVSSTGLASVWDLDSGRVLWRHPAIGFAISGSANAAALLSSDGTMDVCNLDTGEVRWKVRPPAPGSDEPKLGTLCPFGFSLDGSLLAAGYNQKPGFVVYEVATTHPTRFETESPCYPQFLIDAYTGKPRDPRGRLFAGSQSTGNRTIELVNPLSDAKVTTVPNPNERSGWALSNRLAHGIKGELLPRHGLCAEYSGEAGGLIENPLPAELTADGATSRQTTTARIAIADLPVVQFNATPDESKFITVLQDGSVWTTPVEPPPLARAIGEPRGMALSPDGSRLITLGWGLVSCNEVVSGLPLWSRNVGDRFCNYAAWSPDGARVVVTGSNEAGSAACEAYILDGRTGTPLEAWTSAPVIATTPSHPPGPAPWAEVTSGLRFTADGRWLLVGHPDGSISRIDPTTWQPVHKSAAVHLDDPAPGLHQYPTFSGQLIPEPNGPRLAQLATAGYVSTSLATALIVRDGNDAELFVARVAGHAPVSVAWSPDSKWLAAGYAGSTDGIVCELDSATGRERWRTPTPDASVPWHIFVTPDQSRVIALASSSLMVFDFASGDLLFSYKRPSSAEQAEMTNDGSLLLSNSNGSYGWSMVRDDVTDPETQLAAVNRFWPAGVALPSSVADARRQVDAAAAIIMKNPLGGPQTVEPSLAPLVAALTKTVEPSANWYNSWAIGPSIDPNATQADKDRGIYALQKGVAAVPRSLKLQANLGMTLLEHDRYAESLPPLTAAANLYASVSTKGRSAKLELLRAIAAHGAQDPTADDIYRQARDLYDHEAKPDVELKEVREQARKEFGE